ncbi:MAG: hypothetical protein WAN20_09030 [Pseudonocardiaceae bacterium]
MIQGRRSAVRWLSWPWSGECARLALLCLALLERVSTWSSRESLWLSTSPDDISCDLAGLGVVATLRGDELGWTPISSGSAHG